MELDWMWVLVSSLACTSVVATALSFAAMRGQRRVEATLRAHLATLDRDFSALCSSTSQAGDRLVKIEQRSREIVARQERIDTAGPVGSNYRQAMALVERGASAEELVSSCGMARGEAELVAFLYESDQEKASINSDNYKVNLK